MASAAKERWGDATRAVPDAISVSSLDKTFRLPHEKYSTVKERVVHPFTARPSETLQALRGVSFDVPRGEFFGIVGKNGSGKSTLLKCLAGIYRVDAGDVAVNGRLAPFIELGVGFHDDMSARDNVLVNGVMLGLSPKQVRARFDEIIAFAELEDFVGLKLKNYSSGMIVRLAFSVTVQVDADVVLFDEVLAVGDSAFQQKCFRRFERLKSEGKTIVLVTHDMATVARYCDRALLLHDGEVVSLDAADVVARQYDELNRDHNARLAATPAPKGSRPGWDSASAARRKSNRPALLNDLGRTLTLARVLAIAEFKLRYLDSALSYLWSVLRPLAYFAVLYVFVSQVTRLDRGVVHYPAYLFTAVMLWTYFEQTTSTAVYSLVQNQELLRKLPVPRVAIPLSVLFSAFIDLCANLLAVLVALLVSGILPTVGWLELPALILALSILAGGASLLLSALYVRFRDLDQIWTVVTQALFFGTPIFYVVTQFSHDVQQLLLCNPLAVVFTEMRHALVDPGAPSALDVGGSTLLMIPLGIALAVVAAGLLVFRRESPLVAENL